MSYGLFIDKFVHPFILYVLFGTVFSYLMALLAVRVFGLNSSGVKARVYGIPFAVPFIAYLLYRPYHLDICSVHGHPLGNINEWLCFGSEALAKVFTPLFALVAVGAVLKAGFSLFASRRIFRKNGFSSSADFPVLFSILERLCCHGGITMPGIIVTRDHFARSFTMGWRAPIIVLSAGLLEALDEDELETVIAHELGHIARADSLVTWLTVFLRDLMFFTPFIYWVFRKFSAEREMAADDIVIKLTGKPLAFAGALIKVWRMSPRGFLDTVLLDNFSPHPSIVGQAGILEYRVKRIIDNRPIVSAGLLPEYVSVLVTMGLAVSFLYWVC